MLLNLKANIKKHKFARLILLVSFSIFVLFSFNIKGQQDTNTSSFGHLSRHIFNILNPIISAFSHIKVPKASEVTQLSSSRIDFLNNFYQVYQINCSAVANARMEFKNDSKRLDILNRAARLAKKLTGKTRPLSPLFYINATRNCARFIHSRGYINATLSRIEADFPVAYSLQVYKDIEMVERLLRSVYRPQNLYCIHVDTKTGDDFFTAVKAIAGCFDNVVLPVRRVNVTWGHLTVLEADLRCMDALWRSGKPWKYFINLTGQELPLKTNYEIVRVLTAYNGANDVEGSSTAL